MKKEYLLTFELNNVGNVLEIHGNKEGLETLLERIKWILERKDHDHLATESWGGDELSERKQHKDNTLINQVDFRYHE
jgi:hypothetical protein